MGIKMKIKINKNYYYKGNGQLLSHKSSREVNPVIMSGLYATENNLCPIVCSKIHPFFFFPNEKGPFLMRQTLCPAKRIHFYLLTNQSVSIGQSFDQHDVSRGVRLVERCCSGNLPFGWWLPGDIRKRAPYWGGVRKSQEEPGSPVISGSCHSKCKLLASKLYMRKLDLVH